MPVIVETFAHDGQFATRPAPEVVVDCGGRLLRSVDQADAFAGFVTEAVGVEHFAQWLIFDPLHDFVPSFCGAALHAVLDNQFVILLRRFHQFSTFPDVVGDGFFDVNVFAGLQGPDGGQGVPVVGGGNHDGVQLFVFQKFADVGVGVELGFGIGESFFLAVEGDGVWIADCGDADVHAVFEAFEVAGMSGTFASTTDHTYPDGRVGPLDACPGRLEMGGEGESGSCGDTRLKEVSASCFLHDSDWVVGLLSLFNGSCGGFLPSDFLTAHVLHDSDNREEEGNDDKANDYGEENDEDGFDDGGHGTYGIVQVIVIAICNLVEHFR